MNMSATNFLVIIITLFMLGIVQHCNTHKSSDNSSAKQLVTYYKQHQSEKYVITTSFGSAVDDKTNVLTVGPRGPMLIEDVTFFDEAMHFDRERIPERVVHAKGAGAFGVFEVTNNIKKYTKAVVFSEIGKTTPILVRFSSVVSEKGSSDLERDIRGFAIKFYTEQGIWDLTGNNSPVFAVRDPLMFFSFVHSQKKNPATNLKDLNMNWDFFTRRPESLHHVMRLYSDSGTPDGFRHMDGFGVNTFKLVNAQGNATYCKFHYRSNQGIYNLTAEQAMHLQANNPDYLVEDLYDAIAEQNYPSWTFYIQVMTFAQAEQFRWNPFDVTKIWPEDEYPLIEVGKFTLNKNPKNFFAQIEQAAFAPSNMIPGIEPSPDKILQGRLFSYVDTQLYRLGVNHRHIPVNNPYRSKVVNIQRDGMHTYYQDGSPNYYPSSFGILTESSYSKRSSYIASGEVRRYNSSDDDNFTQPGMFWRSLSDKDKKNLVHNIAETITKTELFIQERALDLFYKVDDQLGHMVQSALNLEYNS